MDWTTILKAFGGLTLGAFLRIFVPYVLAALKQLGENGTWLPFDWKYVASFGTALVEYVVACLVADLAGVLVGLDFWAAIVLGYGAGELNRELWKLIPKFR